MSLWRDEMGGRLMGRSLWVSQLIGGPDPDPEPQVDPPGDVTAEYVPVFAPENVQAEEAA